MSLSFTHIHSFVRSLLLYMLYIFHFLTQWVYTLYGLYLFIYSFVDTFLSFYFHQHHHRCVDLLIFVVYMHISMHRQRALSRETHTPINLIMDFSLWYFYFIIWPLCARARVCVCARSQSTRKQLIFTHSLWFSFRFVPRAFSISPIQYLTIQQQH